MNIQQQLAMAAVAKAHKRNGTTPPPALSANPPPKKKVPIDTGADPKKSSQAKNAAAAALASRFGGGGGSAKVAPPAAPGNGSSGGGHDIEKFSKMVKLGIPAPAVRAKMMAEGIPPKIIDEVLSGGGGGGGGGGSASRGAAGRPGVPPPQQRGGASSALSPDDEKIATQYRKMMKIGMPEGAIRHKMNSDKVPQHIQNSVLAGEMAGGPSGGAPSSRPQAPASGRSAPSGGAISKLSPQEEQVAEQYRKMMKIGLPEGAIRHKMVADGVPQHIQQSVLANETPAPAGGGASSAGAGAAAGGSGPVSKLSPEEEQVAAQYRKMIKLGLPDGAVVHKMSGDGVSKKIQDSVLAREVPAVNVEVQRPAGGAAAAFAAGAASLKSAPASTGPDRAVNASQPSGSPLAIAAAAAAARRSLEPSKAPRQVPQNPIPQRSQNATGPAAMAAAAVAAAARRSQRQDSGDSSERFGPKPTPQKVKEEPKLLVSLKSRPVPTNPIPKPRSAPTPSPRADPSPRRGPSPVRNPSPATAPPPAARAPSPSQTQRVPSPAQSAPVVPVQQPHKAPAAEQRTVPPAAPSTSPQVPSRPAVETRTVPPSAPVPPVSSRVESSLKQEPATIEQPTDLSQHEQEASSLTPDEEEVAEHYRGMIREGRSVKSVEEEMIDDGAPAHIRAAVLASAAPVLPSPVSPESPRTATTTTTAPAAVVPEPPKVDPTSAPVIPAQQPPKVPAVEQRTVPPAAPPTSPQVASSPAVETRTVPPAAPSPVPPVSSCVESSVEQESATIEQSTDHAQHDQEASLLTPDEEEVVEHYCGMIREGRSVKSVEEEMIDDGAPAHIRAAVLASAPPVLSSPTTPESPRRATTTTTAPAAVVPEPPKVDPIDLAPPSPTKAPVLLEDPHFVKPPSPTKAPVEAPRQSTPIDYEQPQPSMVMAPESDEDDVAPMESPEYDEEPVETTPTASATSIPITSNESSTKENMAPEPIKQVQETIKTAPPPNVPVPNEKPPQEKVVQPPVHALPPKATSYEPRATQEKPTETVAPKEKVAPSPAQATTNGTTTKEKAAADPASKVESAKKKKKKKRKKTAKGTTILESGAEQHCACVIM